MSEDREPVSSERLEAALAYAAKGWPVFPLYEMREGRCACGGAQCTSPGKHPRVREGLYAATTDTGQIRRWLAQWPEANLGVRTGSESGLFVLDVDVGKGGDESLFELEEQHGKLPSTPESETGGGGRHVLFAHPGGETGNRAHFRPGLDLRADGGYIVVPPSNHASGGVYTWDVTAHPLDLPLAPPPAWLLEILRTASGEQPVTYEPSAWDGGIPERARRILDADVRVRARFDRGTDGLGDPSSSGVDFALAVQLARRGLAGSEIEATLRGSRQIAQCAAKRDGYFTLTVGKALAVAATESERLDLSDLGNAERLVLRYGKQLRYVGAWRQWLVWDGRRWARDTTGEVVRFAKATVRGLYEEAAHEDDGKQRAEIVKHALRSQSERAIRAMIELAKSEPAIPVDPQDLDADLWALNTLSGTVDLRTAECRPHRREDLVTKLAPVAYDPGATSELWESFLGRVLPDAELWSFFQRAVGYSLVGEPCEEVLFFAYGPTAAGKSTALESLGATLGDYASKCDFEHFLARRDVGAPRPEIARLAGARFVSSVEVDEGKRLAEGLVKSLTGGDTVTARRLYQEEFEFRPQFTLWLAANHRPRVRDDDGAFWRRILQVPFDVSIPEGERDPTLKVRLRDPATCGAAILAWALEGCLSWQREGLRVPEHVRAATADYRAEMDPLADFLEERCAFGATLRSSAADLWRSYVDWCGRMKVRPINRRRWAESLRERGLEQARSHGGERCWVGVGITTDREAGNGSGDVGDANRPLVGKPPLGTSSIGTLPNQGHVTSPASPDEESGDDPYDLPWWDR